MDFDKLNYDFSFYPKRSRPSTTTVKTRLMTMSMPEMLTIETRDRPRPLRTFLRPDLALEYLGAGKCNFIISTFGALLYFAVTFCLILFYLKKDRIAVDSPEGIREGVTPTVKIIWDSDNPTASRHTACVTEESTLEKIALTNSIKYIYLNK